MNILELPHSRVIGPPRDWDQQLDGECGSIYVLDAIDLQSGLNTMYTFYKLTEDELEALKNGGILRLGIVGKAHPVFNMAVLSAEIGQTCGAEERWSLGEVLQMPKEGG